MSPTKKAKIRKQASGDEHTPKAKILRATHVHRSRAHTSSVARRRQARRDTK